MTLNRNAIVTAMALILLSATASAQQTQWQKKHPRRTEVNTRLESQNDRIHQGMKSGELSKPEAKQLHKEDRHIRQEERTMAAKNGGHITKRQQRKLNRQENRVSGQIYEEKHDQ